MKRKINWIIFFSLLTALLLTALAGASESAPQETDLPLRAVVLYGERTDPDQMESVLRGTAGVTFLDRYDTLLTGAAVEADAKTLAELSRLPGIAGVGLAEYYECAATDDEKEKNAVSAQDGLALMEADSLLEKGLTGDGAVIAVLDSGCNVDHEVFADASLVKSPALTRGDIEDFAAKGNTKGRYVSSRIPFAYDYYSRDDDVSTTNNHGTHVTALAAGYAKDAKGDVTFRGAAPGAQILSMKIFPNGSGGGTDETIILRALEDAYNLGADAVNLSVGTGAGFSGSDTMNGVFCQAFAEMEASGMAIYCAAGNSAANVLAKAWGQPLPTGGYTDYGSVCSPASFYGGMAIAAASRDASGTVSMAEYSSWGPASGVHLTPALTAFGGPVTSAAASEDDQYRADEGTSMAAPYAAGAYAVLLQSVRERGITDRAKAAATAKGLLASHAKLLTDSASGLPVSPRRQGAGFIDLDAAVTGSLVVTNPLIELGESAEGRFTMPVALQNLSNQSITVSLEVQILTDDYIGKDGITYSRMTPKDITNGVTVTGSRSVTVPARGTATANLSLVLTAQQRKELEQVYPNGFYVEGYVTASGGNESAHAAFLGYCGSWSAAPVLEPVDFRDVQNMAARLSKDGTASQERIPLPENLNDCLTALGSDLGANMAFIAKEPGDMPESGALLGFSGHSALPHDDARNAMPAAGTSAPLTAGEVLCVDVYAQRNAAGIIMVVSDPKTGTVYYAKEETLVEKSDKSVFRDGMAPVVSFAWDGTDTKDAPLPAGTQVRVDVYTWLDGDDEMQSAYNYNNRRKTPESYAWLLDEAYESYRALCFPVTLDGAAPAAEASLEGNTLTLTIHDDLYTAYAAIWDAKGKLLGGKSYAPEQAGEACTLTVDFTGTVPDTVYVRLEDYATNTAGYALDLKSGELTPCASILLADVDLGDWYHEAVDHMVEQGVMVPDEDMEFRPADKATRWEIVDALHRASGSPESKLSVSDLPFHDVSSRNKYAGAICWAYEKGLVAGNPDGAFYGTAGVTRQELALMLYRGAKAAGKDGGSGSLTGYSDAGSVADWAADAVRWAVGAGLIKGNDANQLSPKAGVTRAETAQILLRFMNMK